MIKARFFKEVFYEGFYEPVKELGEMETAIDLGACTGEFSLWVYPQAQKIYAIEANKEVFDSLAENVRDFGKIEPVFLAITGENGMTRVIGKEWGGSRVQTIQDLAGGPTSDFVNDVEAKTLNTFLTEKDIKRVDCLKIDIESSEHWVFQAEDFGKAAEKIDYIIGEPHSDAEPIQKILEGHGYQVEGYPHGFIARK